MPLFHDPPMILAPAGSRASFLAALAAGAEAVYCGLKQFSARMEAKNFTLDELAALTDLAHSKGSRVYVTLNTLIKPDELEGVGRLVDDLNVRVGPDALIIQDPAVIELARQTGFRGELHLSTLAQVGVPAALSLIEGMQGVSRVVLPRELNVDEIRRMAEACPQSIGLEVFVHGALCYGVSGRCYWSSYLGGKSGLRGRCVQPCRRLYRQGGREGRFFSCLDLSLDVLVKVLLTIPAVKGWKIEGRKKGPHYVYHTVLAYKILRDHPGDGKAKKEALHLLDRALGRRGTHYGFLTQRPSHPVPANGHTGSGRLLGKVSWAGSRPFLKIKEELFVGDVLRIGYEDEPWHGTQRINRYLPAGSRVFFPPLPRKGTPVEIPVFLIDRRAGAYTEKMAAMEGKPRDPEEQEKPPSLFQVSLPNPHKDRIVPAEHGVFRTYPPLRSDFGEIGVWLTAENVLRVRKRENLWWWIPPVIWPVAEEKHRSLIEWLLRKGFTRFVINSPWQAAFFPDRRKLRLWAGPFCNLANALAVQRMKSLGCSGAIVSPELGEKDFLALPRHSPLPLGVVLSGHWPLCLSRIPPRALKIGAPFQSPKGETAWVTEDQGLSWIYPNWRLDLTAFRSVLQRAGYCRFIHLLESVPPSVPQKERAGYWNWRIGLL